MVTHRWPRLSQSAFSGSGVGSPVQSGIRGCPIITGTCSWNHILLLLSASRGKYSQGWITPDETWTLSEGSSACICLPPRMTPAENNPLVPTNATAKTRRGVQQTTCRHTRFPFRRWTTCEVPSSLPFLPCLPGSSRPAQKFRWFGLTPGIVLELTSPRTELTTNPVS